MKHWWISFFLLTGCAAPYDVPTDQLSTSFSKIEPEIVTISTDDLNPLDPSEAYVVRQGDTLFSIAFRFEQDPDVLRRRNQVDGDLIYPGQSLKLKGEIRLEPEELAYKMALPPEIHSEKETPLEISGVSDKEISKNVPLRPKSNPKKEPRKNLKREELSISPSLGIWQWPVNGPILETYSTRNKYSRSVKFGGKSGTPVKAAASGRVVYAGDGLIGFGNLIILSHENKYLSAYGHNQSVAVKVGDTVKAGRIIATMGSTGTDVVKLHFEIRKQGKPVDPLALMPKRSF